MDTEEHPRLLSPNHRRLYPNPLTKYAVKADSADSERETHRKVRYIDMSVVGVPDTRWSVNDIDTRTWDNLVFAGWTEYSGPAQTDRYGYIVPGTDPGIVSKGPSVQPRIDRPPTRPVSP